MKSEKRAQQIAEKIKKITEDKTQVIATYYAHGAASVQAELRLHVSWEIRVPVDAINYPRDLYRGYAHANADLWQDMRRLDGEITRTTRLAVAPIAPLTVIPINERTKTGPERRAEAKNLWLIEQGNQFLAEYHRVTTKRNLAAVRKQITALQAQQKALLPALRESNSIYLAGKKSEREAQTAKNTEALKSGRFWEADQDALKGYFHPPFGKNYLADVSEKWRAALFLECESVSFKTSYGNWGHKLSGTGRGYLCGIDDNGDEWGHRVENLPQAQNEYGDGYLLQNNVEEAMAKLFDIAESDLAKSTRQGDLLFFPLTAAGKKIATHDKEVCNQCGVPWVAAATWDDGGHTYHKCGVCGMTTYPHTIKAPILEPCETWTPRESHEITSPSLSHNGVYFRAEHEISVTHTSHAAVILPAGEYRLYALQIVDAD